MKLNNCDNTNSKHNPNNSLKLIEYSLYLTNISKNLVTTFKNSAINITWSFTGNRKQNITHFLLKLHLHTD